MGRVLGRDCELLGPFWPRPQAGKERKMTKRRMRHLQKQMVRSSVEDGSLPLPAFALFPVGQEHSVQLIG